MLYKLPEAAQQLTGGADRPDSSNNTTLSPDPSPTGDGLQQDPAAAAAAAVAGGRDASTPHLPPPSSTTAASAGAVPTDSRGVPLRRAGVQLAAWLRWGSLLSFDSALAAHSLQVSLACTASSFVLPAAFGIIVWAVLCMWVAVLPWPSDPLGRAHLLTHAAVERCGPRATSSSSQATASSPPPFLPPLQPALRKHWNCPGCGAKTIGESCSPSPPPHFGSKGIHTPVTGHC